MIEKKATQSAKRYYTRWGLVREFIDSSEFSYFTRRLIQTRDLLDTFFWDVGLFFGWGGVEVGANNRWHKNTFASPCAMLKAAR